MACFNPRRGIVLGELDGKKKIKIVPYDSIEALETKKRVYEIPCGYCAGCRKARSEEWTNRLLMESLYHDQTYFLTLTYDDDNANWCDYVKPTTGQFFSKESHTMATLSKDDCQKFMKRLRKEFPDDKIRYYIAGEYGGKTHRPHYHAIIFGLHLEQKEFFPFGKSETGEPYFVCDRIQKIWSKGFISIEPANVYTFRYVSNYVMKKLGQHPNEYWKRQLIEPPFSLMSRKPGIGSQYLIEYPEIMTNDNIVIGTEKGKQEFKPPRYFKKKFKEEFPEEYQRIADRHEAAAVDRDQIIATMTDLGKMDYLKVKEKEMIKKENNRDAI